MASLLLSALLAQAPPAGGTAEPTARALAAYREGRCGEARPLLHGILAGSPHNVTLRKLVADCLLREGRPAEARAELERVLEDSPEDGDAQAALRLTLDAMQRPKEARQEKRLASREAASSHLEIQQEFRLAEEMLAAGRRADAQLVLARIVSREPGFAPAVQRLAEVYSATKRFDAAARLYRQLYERQPARPEWLLRAARNLDWAEDWPGAIEAYKAYLALRPGDDDTHLLLADAMRQAGLCHAGLPEYERLVAARPADVRLHLGMALCEDQLGAADLAIEAFLKVLELDPGNEIARRARQRRARDFDELPRRRAYAATQEGDLATAARQLEEYVAKHPESDDALRELADVYAWDQRYAEAESRYREYLGRVPDDDRALRALARVESWGGRLAEARASYEALTALGKARPSDYEELVNVLLWADEVEAAEPYARRLLELAPGSPVAQRALAEHHTRQALRARELAESLEAHRRFREARAAYEAILQAQGKDPEIDLRLCELLSWEGEHAAAAQAYARFLDEHPDNLQARLGLANSLAWKGDAAAAAPHFRTVLAERPADTAALLGLAQALDAAGHDPFEVLAAYDRVLAVDAANQAARGSLADVHRRVAPMLSVDTRTLGDSDELRATTLEASSRFRFPGRLWMTPLYRLSRYRQSRRVVGEGEAIDELNAVIAGRGGSETGHALGVRAGFGGRVQGTGEIAFTTFGHGRGAATGQAEARLQSGRSGTASLAIRRDYAITELNTVASLAAGMLMEVLKGSLDQTLGGRLRLWGTGSLARYSEGSAGSSGSSFPSNRHYRASLGAIWPLGPARVGYVFRQSGFRDRSPLYFSPERYRVHSLQLSLGKQQGAFAWGLDSEAGLADIDGEGSREWAVRGTSRYRLSPRLNVLATGLVSRSSGGLVTGRPYRTSAIELGLERVF